MYSSQNKKTYILLSVTGLLVFGLGVALGWLLHPAGPSKADLHEGAGAAQSKTAHGGLASTGNGSHDASRSVLGQEPDAEQPPAQVEGQTRESSTEEDDAPLLGSSEFANHVKDWIVKEAIENQYRLPNVGHPREDSFDIDEDLIELMDLSDEQARELEEALFQHHKSLRALQKANAVYDDDPDYYGRVVFSPFEQDGKMLRQAVEQDMRRIVGPEKMEFFSKHMDERLESGFDDFGERQMVYCIKPDEEAGKWEVREERYEWDEDDKTWDRRGSSWTTTDVGSELGWPHNEYFEIDPNVAELEHKPD